MNFKEKGVQVYTYSKKNFTSIIAVVILGIGLYFLVKDSVSKVEAVNIAKSDTTRSITYVTQPIQHLQSYTPFMVRDTVPKYIIVPPQYIPSDDIKRLQEQVAELGQKLFKKNRYNDTIYLKDTSGKDVGIVNVDDSITENMIASRNVNYSLKFPKETITVNNYIAPKPKAQLFLGPEVTLNSKYLPNQVGVGAFLKTKGNSAFRFSSGAQFTTPVSPYFSAGYYKMLHVGKK